MWFVGDRVGCRARHSASAIGGAGRVL